MSKKILFCAALVLAIFAGAAQKRQVMLDRVVAVVGGSSILWSEVDEYAGELVEQRRQQGYTSDRDPHDEALEQLLMQKLLFNQALIDSVDVSYSGIAQRVEAHLQALIDDAGSIAALERYYKKTDPDSLPTIPEQYVYAQITRFPASIKEAKQRTKERLLDMRERIIKGQTRFDIMARMYSMDGSAISGGELDPQPLDGFVRQFADALADLKPGQVSEVVETQYGYHLIQLIDQKGRMYHARHIVLRPSYTLEELAAPARMLDSIANLIRKDSITFEEAARKFSDDDNSKMNGGVVTNHDLLELTQRWEASYTETRFMKEDFGRAGGKSLDDYNALRNLKEGEISDAYQTEDWMGNQLSKIVKLVKVIPPHKVSLDEDYIRVEQLALNAKREKVFKEWLDKKIEGMYIYIDPEFRDGEFENKNWVK